MLDLCLRFRALALTLDATPSAQQPRRQNRRTTSRRRLTKLTAESESDGDDDLSPDAPGPGNAAAVTHAAPDAGLDQETLRDMNVELVNEVLHLRQGVEVLAAGTLSTSPMFSSIVFNLQSWDL